jgi:hypothetical protein
MYVYVCMYALIHMIVCGQILHYDEGQQFTEHHDYFDPATDPPENYVKGGNRLLTVIMYLAVSSHVVCRIL